MINAKVSCYASCHFNEDFDVVDYENRKSVLLDKDGHFDTVLLHCYNYIYHDSENIWVCSRKTSIHDRNLTSICFPITKQTLKELKLLIQVIESTYGDEIDSTYEDEDE